MWLPLPSGSTPFAPPRSATRDDTIELDPELEWKWVEAAASAWLSKRDVPLDEQPESNNQA